MIASGAPIPAETPISGPLWTLVVPALLLAVTFVATWLLYRRFSREGRHRDGSRDRS